MLEQVATERGEALKIVSINVDDNVEYAAKLGVMSVPALMIFKDGELVNKTFGAYPKRHLESWIDDSLSVGELAIPEQTPGLPRRQPWGVFAFHSDDARLLRKW